MNIRKIHRAIIDAWSQKLHNISTYVRSECRTKTSRIRGSCQIHALSIFYNVKRYNCSTK